MREIDVSPVVRTDGAKQLARYLAEGISNGTLAVGVKLPAERELSERFQASRGAVRRVLGELKNRGFVSQVVGSGTFVAPASAAVAAAFPGGIGMISPAELMQARLLIEPLMVPLIVQYGTAQDFVRMDECIAQSEAAKTVEEFEHWDGSLHEALAAATHNHFFLQVLALMTQVREQGEWGRLKRQSLTAEHRAVYEAQHRTLVAALKDRDEASGRLAIDQHLRRIQGNLFGDRPAGG